MNKQANFKRLGAFVEEIMKKHQVPGVAVGILQDDTSYTAGFGVTNINHPLPVTDTTLFQIGSISKTVLGTAIMRLIEMGDLNLDQKIRSFIPDFQVRDPVASEQATIRHLLTHTGGWIGDFFIDTGSGSDAPARYVAEMARLEQLAPMGTTWSYNNAGFCVAGRIIEIVTGESYEQALDRLILKPLGMKRAFLNPSDVMLHRFAVGHREEEGAIAVSGPWPLPRAIYAAGGICCHIKDLLRYARFHLGDGTVEDGTRLLKPESLRLMRSPQVTIRDSDEMMGLSWLIGHINEAQYIGHSGGTTGQISLLRLVPEDNFAFAIVTNVQQGGAVTEAISNWVFEHYLDEKMADLAPDSLTVDQLDGYLGRYSRPYADIDLELHDGNLSLQVTFKQGFPTAEIPPRAPLPWQTVAIHKADHLITMGDGPSQIRGDFFRNPDGTIGWLRWGSRLHKRTA